MVAAVQRAEQVYSSPSSHPHLRIYKDEPTRTPIPNGYEAILGDKLENLNLQVLNTPAHITHPNDREDKGIYLVEFNLDHVNFSGFNHPSLEELKEEIRKIESQPNVKHLVLSFYDCHSLEYLRIKIKDNPKLSESQWTVNGGDYFADLLMEARTYCRLNDKKLSIVHNEPKLEIYGDLKGLPGFIHLDLEDAIANSNSVNSKPALTSETTIPPSRFKQFTVLD